MTNEEARLWQTLIGMKLRDCGCGLVDVRRLDEHRRVESWQQASRQRVQQECSPCVNCSVSPDKAAERGSFIQRLAEARAIEFVAHCHKRSRDRDSQRLLP